MKPIHAILIAVFVLAPVSVPPNAMAQPPGGKTDPAVKPGRVHPGMTPKPGESPFRCDSVTGKCSCWGVRDCIVLDGSGKCKPNTINCSDTECVCDWVGISR